MIKQIYTVFDAAAQLFHQPFYTHNHATAKRSFENAVNDEHHEFSRNAMDFTLFHVGSYDEATGLHTALSAPEALGNALTFVRSDAGTAVALQEAG